MNRVNFPAAVQPLVLLLLLVLFSAPPATLVAQKGSKKAPVANNDRFGPLQADHPAANVTDRYPLLVHIFSIHSGGDNATYRGYGSGNILGISPEQGFDYTFDCQVPFLANKEPKAAYPARWKSQPHTLELLMLAPDNVRTDTCILKLTLRDAPFDPAHAAFLGNGDEKVKPDYEPGDFPDSRPNPDFPLQFHIRVVDHIQQLNAGAHGHGYGILLDQPGKEYKFHYECNPGILANTEREDFYQARWNKQDVSLEVLTRPAGSDTSHQCALNVQAAD